MKKIKEILKKTGTYGIAYNILTFTNREKDEFLGKRRIINSFKEISKFQTENKFSNISFFDSDCEISLSNGLNFRVAVNSNSPFIISENGKYEYNETAFLKKHIPKNSTVIDVGANLGWYSAHLSLFVGKKGRVFSFEPVPSSYKKLTTTIEINNIENITTINEALGNTNGIIQIFCPDAEFNGSASQFTKNGKPIQCRIQKLDDFVVAHRINKLDFIKVDIEGGEFNFLDGAKKTLENLSPELLIEIEERHCSNSGHKSSDIFAFLYSLGYKSYLIKDKGSTITFDYLKEKAIDGNYFFSKKSETL